MDSASAPPSTTTTSVARGARGTRQHQSPGYLDAREGQCQPSGTVHSGPELPPDRSQPGHFPIFQMECPLEFLLLGSCIPWSHLFESEIPEYNDPFVSTFLRRIHFISPYLPYHTLDENALTFDLSRCLFEYLIWTCLTIIPTPGTDCIVEMQNPGFGAIALVRDAARHYRGNHVGNFCAGAGHPSCFPWISPCR